MGANIFDCEAFSLQHITTVEEVNTFARYLVYEMKLNFHPDDDFVFYRSNSLDARDFTEEEIATGNRLMYECFAVCEKENSDIYEVMGHYLVDFVAENRRERA